MVHRGVGAVDARAILVDARGAERERHPHERDQAERDQRWRPPSCWDLAALPGLEGLRELADRGVARAGILGERALADLRDALSEVLEGME